CWNYLIYRYNCQASCIGFLLSSQPFDYFLVGAIGMPPAIDWSAGECREHCLVNGVKAPGSVITNPIGPVVFEIERQPKREEREVW
ncbi:MAG: hypothetical protein JAY85_10055, partial [Candidatus Thiodiazotropha weberae]|nr:hypothetical protein [Candidatus Thiodiazotropha weberae]